MLKFILRKRGNTLLEIRTPDIRISRIPAGYQKCNKRVSRENLPNFNEIPARFQQNIKKYLLDLLK